MPGYVPILLINVKKYCQIVWFECSMVVVWYSCGVVWYGYGVVWLWCGRFEKKIEKIKKKNIRVNDRSSKDQS